MSTNDDTAVDDSTTVTEEDLRKLKYDNDEVETSTEEDESSETEETKDNQETGEEAESDQATEETEDDQTESVEESTEFVKKFTYIKGDTPEEYAKNLEAAYDNSTTEALKWKKEAESKDQQVGDTKESVNVSDPSAVYVKQKMDEEINEAFNEFSKHFPQVTNPVEYERFKAEVNTLSNTIFNSQGRLASPKELYSKAAVILDWEPQDKVDGKDRLDAALKNSAATSKTSSSTKKPTKSKVDDKQMALNRIMYPNKTDEEIRKELEPYVK